MNSQRVTVMSSEPQECTGMESQSSTVSSPSADQSPVADLFRRLEPVFAGNALTGQQLEELKEAASLVAAEKDTQQRKIEGLHRELTEMSEEIEGLLWLVQTIRDKRDATIAQLRQAHEGMKNKVRELERNIWSRSTSHREEGNVQRQFNLSLPEKPKWRLVQKYHEGISDYVIKRLPKLYADAMWARDIAMRRQYYREFGGDSGSECSSNEEVDYINCQ